MSDPAKDPRLTAIFVLLGYLHTPIIVFIFYVLYDTFVVTKKTGRTTYQFISGVWLMSVFILATVIGLYLSLWKDKNPASLKKNPTLILLFLGGLLILNVINIILCLRIDPNSTFLLWETILSTIVSTTVTVIIIVTR